MANGSGMILSVQKELGAFYDVATFPDTRILDYLNEGQALLAPDVTRTMTALIPIDASDLFEATPSNFIRINTILPDPNFSGTHRVPPFQIVDGQFYWLDRIPRPASQMLLIYEARFPPFAADASAIVLPDPGPEGLVAFASMRCLQRLIGDRSAYRRYATQTGSNVVQPEDLERLAEVWHQRYLQTREVLAQRIAIAAAETVAQF